MNPDDTRPDAQATRNFLASGGHEFNGKPVGPFTAQRMAVASEMGMTWPYVKEEDQITLTFEVDAPGKGKKKGTKQPVKIQHYRQSYKDSIIALWLCIQLESRVDRAERKPKEAMDEAYAWAKNVGLLQGTPVCGEALGVWLSICTEIVESRSTPVQDKPGGKGPKEEDDSLG